MIRLWERRDRYPHVDVKRGRRMLPILVGAVSALACNTTAEQGRATRQAIVVETVTPQRMSVQRQVDLSGTLFSPDQPRVSSEAAGVVRQVLIEIGHEVNAGDALVRLEPRELQLALERAESALRQVQAQLGIDRTHDNQPPPDEEVASVRQAIANRDDARNAFARAQQLSGRGLLSPVDRDTAETRLKVTEANYQAAMDNVRSLKASLQDRRAAFELAQKKLNDAVIRTPIAGSVSERLVQSGEFIRENTPVATIVQMNPLKLKTAVQEKFAAIITPGQAVEFRVEAFPEQAFNGKVAYVSPAVDQATRTFAVEALVANDDHRLKPGFFAKGTVATRLDENVLAVPEEAVSTFAGVSSVYVVNDGKVQQQTVTIGVQQGKLIEVVAGLTGEETLATSNLSQLATGTTVRISGAEERAGAAPNGAANGRADMKGSQKAGKGAEGGRP